MLRTTAVGHEEQFSPPTLSARYVIRQETFAGTHGNVRGAPKPAVRRTRGTGGRPIAVTWRRHGDRPDQQPVVALLITV